MIHIDTIISLLTRGTEHMNKRVGDYCPTPEAHSHPTPLPELGITKFAGVETDDGPLTERCPSNLAEVNIDVSEYVSLFLEPLAVGAIYLVRRPGGVNSEPMYLRGYQDDIVMFQDAVGNRLTMGTNLARECISKRFVTADILTALAKVV
jgi:hypothetical protein